MILCSICVQKIWYPTRRKQIHYWRLFSLYSTNIYKIYSTPKCWKTFCVHFILFTTCLMSALILSLFMYCLDSNRNFVKSKQKNKINRYKTCLDCSTVYKFITCSGHTKLMITSFYFVLNFFCRSFDLKKSRFYFIYFLSEKIIFESICSEIVSKFKWKKY